MHFICIRKIVIIKYRVQKNKRYFSFIFHYRKPHTNGYKGLTRSDRTQCKTILQDNFSTHDTTHMTTKNKRQKIKIPGHSPKLGTSQGSAVTHNARIYEEDFLLHHLSPNFHGRCFPSTKDERVSSGESGERLLLLHLQLLPRQVMLTA